MNRRFQSLLPLVPLLVLMILMEVLVRLQIIPSYLLPAPSEVALALRSPELWYAFLDTTLNALIGFLIASFFGLSLGILFSSARCIHRAFYPYAVFFQTVPIIAIAPLLVIWFGYGSPTVIASAAIVAIFPMIAASLTGLHSTDPALRDLFRLYGATRFQTLLKLRLLFALPQIFVGLRISAGLAVIGAIVGEFIAGGGLGGIVDVARTRQRVDQVFAAVLLASLIGLLFVHTIQFVAKASLKHWHPSEKPI